MCCVALSYNARMVDQPQETFGQALKKALRAGGVSQAELSRRLDIDPGQVSRWATDKALPQAKTVERMETELGADLSGALQRSAPICELYVSSPILGLGRRGVAGHHEAVSAVVDAASPHVNAYYWPGSNVRSTADLLAADIATENNMRVFQHCQALLFLQFGEIVRPSSSLIELGLALGMRKKTTVIWLSELQRPFMLNGFQGVAASLSFLPKARIYEVESVDEACDLIDHNGRQLFGLE